MRAHIKRFIQGRLERYAKMAIARYQPTIIGVAGSVGKTSTKEAIFCVLSKYLAVRKSAKSYNNEFGVPLTVLGIESGFRSIFKWMRMLRTAKQIATVGSPASYPKCLVLEMGSDHVGDVAKLMAIAPPTIGVLTAIAPVHLEFFGTIENVQVEESTIIRNLDGKAIAIINKEDAIIRQLEPETKATAVSYGLSDAADVWADNIRLFSSDAEGNVGAECTVHAKGESIDIFLPHALGNGHVLSAVAAVAVGLQLKITLKDIAVALKEFLPPPGRMRMLSGIKKTHLIDDTYNSSPNAVALALDALAKYPTKKVRYAVLGDMAELGAETVRLHTEVGKSVKQFADCLITVGEKARDIARGARESGMQETAVFSFPNAGEAGHFLQDRIHEGDVVLIKGSQIVRMEKIVKEIMANPERADTLLVRQETYWEK